MFTKQTSRLALEFRIHVGATLPKANSKFAPIFSGPNAPRRKGLDLPTINFQVLLLLVSGRISSFNPESTAFPRIKKLPTSLSYFFLAVSHPHCGEIFKKIRKQKNTGALFSLNITFPTPPTPYHPSPPHPPFPVSSKKTTPPFALMTCLHTRSRELIAHDFVRCRCRLASPRGGRRAMELFFRYEIPIELWDGQKGAARGRRGGGFVGVEVLKCVVLWKITGWHTVGLFLFGGWALFKNVSLFFPTFFAFFFFLEKQVKHILKTLLKPPFSLKHLTTYNKILIDSRIDIVSMNDFLGEVVIFHKPPPCKSMLVWEHPIFLGEYSVRRNIFFLSVKFGNLWRNPVLFFGTS